MIKQDLYQIWAPATGKFLHMDFRSPGFAAGETPRPGTWIAIFEESPLDTDKHTRANAERTLANENYPIQRDRLEIVPAAQCGCCGLTDARWSNPKQLRMVADAAHPRDRQWRCEKHVGRSPCCIDGCGRTFALKADEDYATTFICGRHWREAPRYMRDRVARLRKRAKRLNWPERLARIHDKAFDLAVRAVREGRHLDMTEINRMFGW